MSHALYWLVRPRPFDWIRDVLAAAALVAPFRRSEWLSQIVDSLLSVVGTTRSDALALGAFSACLIGLCAISVRFVPQRVWTFLLARDSFNAFNEHAILRALIVGNSIVHVKGASTEHVRSKAFEASRRWSLSSESVSLCPLPEVRLAIMPLAAECGLGAAAVAAWLIAHIGAPIAHPPAILLSVCMLIVGSGLILHGLCWAGGVPFAVSGAALVPGGLVRNGPFGEKRADSATDGLVVYCSRDPAAFHLLVVVPARGAPWSMTVPGNAIDLVVGAWLARDFPAPTDDASSLCA